ncbi:MAG: fumarylacetoacetate hydrolase family protein [Gammaproteobacteria bacterium]
MYLTRHSTAHGARWAADGRFLPEGLTLATMLRLAPAQIEATVEAARGEDAAEGTLLAPIEHGQEVWAAGVTYLRSREARMHESDTADIYEKVYEAERVEVFFKSAGWRVRGHEQPIRVRADSAWNVPEPELVLVLNEAGAIVGYTAGNDVSSRDIEGANPLYLPQAKVYDGSCAIGPGIMLAHADEQRALPLTLKIVREGKTVYEGETNTDQLKRGLEEMAGWLTRELAFPEGVFLMTGTCLVPADDFTLTAGDEVTVQVGNLSLLNTVAG